MRVLSEKDIKQSIFEILSAFADYCDTHGLRYYLCGGTLLGAVRHKDFIPWDDDIDILMPRPDYIRLQKLVEKQPIASYYHFKCFEQGSSLFPFGKIVDIRTKVVTKYNDLDSVLWIDIFPMDGVPDDQKRCDYILKKAHKWKIMHGRTMAKIGTGTTYLKKILKLPFLIVPHVIGTKRCAKHLDVLAKRYNFDECEYVAGITWSNGPLERMKKEDFIPYEDKEFHGRMFHAPACWDFYLKAMYGDYMKLPPQNKRYAHMIDAYWIGDMKE
ncbi:MAG: LicD family protein [Roseburia sp.]|nr:LicD family protein [Roseburia sp.]